MGGYPLSQGSIKTEGYDPRKDPQYGCKCWLSDKLDFPHEHDGWNIVRWNFGPDMPYADELQQGQ